MNGRSKIIFFAILLFSLNSYAASFNKDKRRAAAKVAQASTGEENYDVKYLRFNLHLTDTSIYVSGDVSTTAQVIAPGLSTYVFELDPLLTIDSAKINGNLLAVTTVGFTRTVALPLVLSAGAFFTAQIFYHGMPPIGGGFFNGITHAISAHGTHMIYTVSDPWVAKDWWPAKQSATDKIDSVDMFITVPRGVVDGSNGLLVNVDTTTTPGFWQYHWQSHYPIDYYLISIAVARYAEYKSYLHFTGSTDSMLVQNFFVDTATFNPLYKVNFDSIGLIIDYYSSLFGRYPFWQEKYGVCYTTLPGGMENQTMTTIGTPGIDVIAHELMHQWFGDNVTYATWGEMWLSEGFATFAEQLYLTHFWGAAAGKAHRQTLLNSALSVSCGEIYVTDTSGPSTLFNQPTVYYKGQGVVTMLRYLAPSDSAFFLAMRTYQQAYSFGNASVDNMAAIVNSVYGFSVDSFLHQWIYGMGYPKYTIKWDQVGSSVFVKLIQTRSCPLYNVHFNTPVEVQLHGATGDTFVMAYNTLDTELFTFTWDQPMDSLLLNPDALTICKQLGVIRQDTNLRNEVKVGQISIPSKTRVFPNPSKSSWQVDQLPDNAGLLLTDVNGRTIWSGKSAKGSVLVPGAGLPAGDYYLKVSGIDHSDSIKLVHW
jgi:aminopeptidase N